MDVNKLVIDQLTIGLLEEAEVGLAVISPGIRSPLLILAGGRRALTWVGSSVVVRSSHASGFLGWGWRDALVQRRADTTCRVDRKQLSVKLGAISNGHA